MHRTVLRPGRGALARALRASCRALEIEAIPPNGSRSLRGKAVKKGKLTGDTKSQSHRADQGVSD